MSRHAALLFPVIALVVVALTACGGKGSPASDEEAAGAAATRYLKTFLGLLDGSAQGKDFLEVFAPECRKGVNAGDIDGVLSLIRAFAPDLGKTHVEAVDLGQLEYRRTAEGIEVTPKDTSAIRVKANGKWMTADEFFQTGMVDSTDEPAAAEALLMVKRDGKWYVGDCSQLQDLSGSLGGAGLRTAASRGARADEAGLILA